MRESKNYEGEASMSPVTMYGADWCGDCRRSKRFLDSSGVDYKYVDVEAEESPGAPRPDSISSVGSHVTRSRMMRPSRSIP